MFTTHRERRNRLALANAQAAWDNAADPLWDGPEPDYDEDASDDDENGARLEADPARD